MYTSNETNSKYDIIGPIRVTDNGTTNIGECRRDYQ